MDDTSPMIYIVDDDPSVLKSLTRLISTEGYDVTPFTRAGDFLEHTKPHGPSCLVLDLNLPDQGGLDVQEEMSRRNLTLPIVFITGCGSISESVRAMKKGAVDFLTKPLEGEALIEAIRQALEKQKSSGIEETELSSFRERVESLSKRQREIFDGIIRGRLNKQIASDLGIKEKTVKVHRGLVMEKLEAENFAELVRLAEKAGYSRDEGDDRQ
ncbi:MAG: response regulator transcription factor [Candidatus Xenobiia bacterium LiM19]